MGKYIIAIDLGGTNIKAGLLSRSGRVLLKKSIPTVKDSSGKLVIDDMANLAKTLSSQANINFEDVLAIGVGSPGLIDSQNGVVVYWNNLDWHNVELGKSLNELTGKEVFVTNDANAAALGEAIFGSGKEFLDSVFVTLGTGVGGGIVIDGKLYQGYKSAGAEIGHMVIIKNGEQCTCGRRGCLESYASATALVRDTKNSMKHHKSSIMWQVCQNDIEKASARTAFEAARQGDKPAQDIVNNYIEYLAEGIINLVNVLRPQIVILGGGVCNEGDYLLNPLKELIFLRMYGGTEYAPVEIKVAKLGNDAGIMGAFAFARQGLKDKKIKL